MPVSDISDVTTTLRRLVEFAISPKPTVSTNRPEAVDAVSAALNIYCYHVTEDPNNRYRPRSEGGIETSPLTLEMHFIVTALMPVASEFDTLTEQRLLGEAMKTFHDHPVIDDATVIGTDRILPTGIQGLGNRFEIVPVQTSPKDAFDFWANQDRITVKPSAYYVVRPIEIIPERPSRVPGIVLSLGAFVGPIDVPTIGATESTVPYSLPTDLGGGSAVLTTSPAQVGPVTADPLTRALRLLGASLAKGTSQTLYLANAVWTLQHPGFTRFPVDLALNPGWAQKVATDSVEIAVGDDFSFRLPDGTTQSVSLYPGNYVVSWLVSYPFEGPLGTETVDQRSNSAPFSVVPRITSMARNSATGAVSLSFGGSWRLNLGRPLIGAAHEEPELDILLSVDGDSYALEEAANPTAPGRFTISDHSLTYLPRSSNDTVGTHAVVVVVEGAAAQPFWVEIP